MYDTDGIVYATFRVMLRCIMAQYMKSNNNSIDKEFMNEMTKKFANNNVKNSMISFGDSLHYNGDVTDIKRSIKYLRREYRNVRNHYDNNVFIDSGGYQIQTNYIDYKNVPYLIDGYCEMIQNMKEKNVYYFIEDIIATSYNKEKIPSMEIAKNLTIDGIKKMSQLPEEKRKNIYFIYHFQSKQIFDAWQEILKYSHPNEFLGSHRWAVGGIVSDTAVPKNINYITYMYPIIDIIQSELNYLKNKGRVNLHILGVTAYLDIFFFALLKKLFSKFNYDVNISFDSTQPIISVCRGHRFLHYDKINDYFFEVDLGINNKSNNIRNADLNNHSTQEEFIINEIQNLKNKYNFVGTPNNHYIDSTNNKLRICTEANYIFTIKQLLMLQFLFDWSYEKSDNILELYYSDYNEFVNYLSECCYKIRGNTIINHTKLKIKNIINTLNLFDSILQGKKYSVEFIRNIIEYTLDKIDYSTYNNHEDIIKW